MDGEGPWMDGKGNAYEVLGVAATCDDATIKWAFTKLAKATHPDMLQQPSSTARFISVLAAYKILSDPQKRAQYDAHLELQLRSSLDGYQPRKKGNSDSEKTGQVGNFDECGIAVEEGDIVSWLRWYRILVKDMVHRQEIGAGDGFQEHIRGELQSALRVAYFGPHFDRLDEVPNCFEAEERADPGVDDILQLVSGRQVFGAVRRVYEGSELLNEGKHGLYRKYMSLAGKGNTITAFPNEIVGSEDAVAQDPNGDESEAEAKLERSHSWDHRSCNSDVNSYIDLELQLFGKLVARATRIRAMKNNKSLQDGADKIFVYLYFDPPIHSFYGKDKRATLGTTGATDLHEQGYYRLLGTIRGLSTSLSGGTCTVHAPDGQRTHTILQHRTPLVKHVHWYRFNAEVAHCECRSSRARLPPSKFWLFEPRCNKYNVGGWYIELFGRHDHAGLPNVLRHKRGSVKYSDNGTSDVDSSIPVDWTGKASGTLHPAMYIITAAYNTLDAEVEQLRKKSFISVIKGSPSLYAAAVGALVWCKGKLPFIK